MKKPAKKLSMLAFLPLLVTVFWLGCNLFYSCHPGHVQYYSQPVIQGSQGLTLTADQKNSLSKVLDSELARLPGVRKCHLQCNQEAKVTAVFRLDEPSHSYMVMITWHTTQLHRQSIAAIPTTSTLDTLLKRAVESLGKKLIIHQLPTAQLLIQLDEAQNDDERSNILTELADRGDQQVIPSLGQFLRQKHSIGIFTQALGVLVALNSPAAAQEIIASVRQQNAEALIQIIYALEQIPCESSNNYLETMAGGHPDQKVRSAAKTVLENRQRHVLAAPAVEEKK